MMKKISKEAEDKIISDLKDLQDYKDIEAAHANADTLLCEFLTALGYGNVVEEYGKIDKWYA